MSERDDKGRFKPREPQIGVVHGLPLTISPQAADLLAAFHLGFSEALTFYREFQRPVVPQAVVFPQEGLELGEEEPLTMPPGLNPLAAAAWREAHGIKPPVFPEEEHRPEEHPAYKEMEEEMRMQGLGENKE